MNRRTIVLSSSLDERLRQLLALHLSLGGTLTASAPDALVFQALMARWTLGVGRN